VISPIRCYAIITNAKPKVTGDQSWTSEKRADWVSDLNIRRELQNQSPEVIGDWTWTSEERGD
jgi:hypothetical protein